MCGCTAYIEPNYFWSLINTCVVASHSCLHEPFGEPSLFLVHYTLVMLTDHTPGAMRYTQFNSINKEVGVILSNAWLPLYDLVDIASV